MQKTNQVILIIVGFFVIYLISKDTTNVPQQAVGDTCPSISDFTSCRVATDTDLLMAASNWLEGGDNPPPADVTCTNSDTNWNCGEYSTCSGLFYTRECCRYNSGMGSIVEATEYYYCDESDKFYNDPFSGSSYGTVRIYLATPQSIGWSQQDLNNFASAMDSWFSEATYGMFNNVEFVTEANADFSNPGVSHSRFGTDIKVAFHISDVYPTSGRTFFRQFSSGINWLMSSASFHSIYVPWGWTTIPSTHIYDGTGCFARSNSGGYIDLCKTTAHELGHAMFGCRDYDGDIMRPLLGLNDNNHYSPICLERVKYYIPQLVS